MVSLRNKAFLIVTILTLFFFVLISCNDSKDTVNEKDEGNESTTDEKDNTESEDENNSDKENNNPEESLSYKKIISEILPEDESTYEIHYFAYWDFEEDYPYNKVDNYWKEMHDVGFFKFYYDKDGKKIVNVKLQTNVPIQIAIYDYKNTSKSIKWVKHYSSETGEPELYDLLEYYPNGRIKTLKSFSNADGKEELLMKIEYGKIEKKNGEYIRINRYYGEDGKEKMYAETKYQYIAGLYEESPQYIKEKVIRYIAFGKHKDKWFSILRYKDGEPQNVDINETKTDEGKTYEQYMEEEFPQFFMYKHY